MDTVIGWDIGGAHLKAAQVADGRLVDLCQLPSPLWQGLAPLDRAIAEVLERWPGARLHAVTMTGELADLFPDRAQGVHSLVEAMLRQVPAASLRVHSGRSGLQPPQQAVADWPAVASANWLVSAAFAARRMDHGVLLDIGSTTSDIIAFDQGKVLTASVTDADRLACNELVYTGVVRTPVYALADRAPFAGAWQGLTAELFATSADVYRLLGLLPDNADLLPSADNRDKSVEHSVARLARMLGRDATDAPLSQWRELAGYLARCQVNALHDAFDRVVSGSVMDYRAAVVGAGVGRFLAERIARDGGRDYVDFAKLLGPAPTTVDDLAADCAPAAALALLAATGGDNGVDS